MLPLMNQTPKEMATGTPNTLIGNQYLNQPCTNSGIPSTYYTPGNAYSWQAGAIGNGCNISSAYEQIRFGVVSNNENNEIFNTFDTALGIGIGGTRGTYGSGLVAYAFSVPCSSLIGTNGNGFYKALLWVR
jgi:hypothetical protein